MFKTLISFWFKTKLKFMSSFTSKLLKFYVGVIQKYFKWSYKNKLQTIFDTKQKHASKTRQTRKQCWRRSRQHSVPFFRFWTVGFSDLPSINATVMEPWILIVKISISSLYHVIVRPTIIVKRAVKIWSHF